MASSSEGGVHVIPDNSEIQIKSEEMKSSIREEYGSVPQTDNLETQKRTKYDWPYIGANLPDNSEIQIQSEEMKSSIREEYGSVPQTDNLETQKQTKFQRLNKEHLQTSTLRCKIIQFVHHLLFYLAFVVIDLYIGLKYYQDDKFPGDFT